MDIRTILSTDLRLLEPICAFTDHDGYGVYRSDMFRNYYGANGIDIHDPRALGLREWEEIFHRHFEPDLFEHITFTFPRDPIYTGLMEEASRSGYHVEIYSFSFAGSTDACPPLPRELSVRRIESEEEWNRYYTFLDRESVDEDWYDPSITQENDRLFAKTRYTTEKVGIEWFYLCHEASDEILASLGLFLHNGIARLQNVRTSREHRRKGLATLLVGYAIDRAITTLGAKGVAVCADTDYYAIDLYRKLGFVEQGEGVTMMKYPVRNPALMKE